MKKHLIINQYAPLEELHTEEIIELALSISTLNQELSILLLKDALLQLISNQDYNLVARPLLDQTIKAFALFEFKNIYIEKSIYNYLKLLNISIASFFKNKVVLFDLRNLSNLTKDYDMVWYF
jgi:sulfur relay (sulfurtransferase) DsrF/TusC family protein